MWRPVEAPFVPASPPCSLRVKVTYDAQGNPTQLEVLELAADAGDPLPSPGFVVTVFLVGVAASVGLSDNDLELLAKVVLALAGLLATPQLIGNAPLQRAGRWLGKAGLYLLRVVLAAGSLAALVGAYGDRVGLLNEVDVTLSGVGLLVCVTVLAADAFLFQVSTLNQSLGSDSQAVARRLFSWPAAGTAFIIGVLLDYAAAY